MAEKLTHTLGPWEMVSLSGYGSPFSVRMPYISDRPEEPATHYGVQSVRRREDALLIAAAPELLAAVRDARDMLAMVEVIDGEDGDPWSAALARMDAAIAKATGRAALNQDGGARDGSRP